MLARIWWHQWFQIQHFVLNLRVKYSLNGIAKWQKVP